MSDEGLEERIAGLNGGADVIASPLKEGDKRTYSVEEVMEILDISRSTAYQLIRKKLFKSVKAGKQIRVSKKSFDGWLDAT